MTQEIIDLIQAEVDGQNSPAQTARIQALCAQDPAIREEFNAALAIGRMLDGIPDATVPYGFAANVMEQLPDNPSWKRHRAPSRAAVQRSRSSWFSRPILQLSYGLIVGVFVTFAVMTSINPSAIPSEGLSGTMMGIDATETIDIGTDAPIQLGTTVDEDGISIRIEGQIPEEGEISIRFIAPDGSIIDHPINFQAR